MKSSTFELGLGSLTISSLSFADIRRPQAPENSPVMHYMPTERLIRLNRRTTFSIDPSTVFGAISFRGENKAKFTVNVRDFGRL